jgi:hypothetical protein
MNSYALAATKKYFASRKRVCQACLLDRDLNYGRSFMRVACARCGEAVQMTVVVEEMRGRI